MSTRRSARLIASAGSYDQSMLCVAATGSSPQLTHSIISGGGPIAACVFYIGSITVATCDAKGLPPVRQITAIAATAAAHLVSWKVDAV